ncbi:hypothetical protein [Cesiribacter sp. SM1]|uniref:hypothetical protein n=1 Tax=Cesiribacter sp. SM1 TaxID=2861196 RepID=UPI001CD7B8B8|nr:hypothetical protein [Cesiribacter sp. SM1]
MASYEWEGGMRWIVSMVMAVGSLIACFSLHPDPANRIERIGEAIRNYGVQSL